ncbi:MAG: hypothetical protein HY609_06340 [Deltaproteobacteria bacterium]|nr:hypothetical protein [Deltaproteobacteria bacterium]
MGGCSSAVGVRPGTTLADYQDPVEAVDRWRVTDWVRIGDPGKGGDIFVRIDTGDASHFVCGLNWGTKDQSKSFRACFSYDLGTDQRQTVRLSDGVKETLAEKISETLAKFTADLVKAFSSETRPLHPGETAKARCHPNKSYSNLGSIDEFKRYKKTISCLSPEGIFESPDARFHFGSQIALSIPELEHFNFHLTIPGLEHFHFENRYGQMDFQLTVGGMTLWGVDVGDYREDPIEVAGRALPVVPPRSLFADYASAGAGGSSPVDEKKDSAKTGEAAATPAKQAEDLPSEHTLAHKIEHTMGMLELINEITTLLRAGGGENAVGIDRSAIGAIIRGRVFDHYFYYIQKKVDPFGSPPPKAPPLTFEMKINHYETRNGMLYHRIEKVKVPNTIAYNLYLQELERHKVIFLQKLARLEMLKKQYERGEFGTEEAIRRHVLQTYPEYLKTFEANLAYAKRVAERIVSSSQREKGEGRDAIEVAWADLSRAFEEARKTNPSGGFARDFLYTEEIDIEGKGNAPGYTVLLSMSSPAKGPVKPSVVMVCRRTSIEKCMDAGQESGLHIIDFTAERMAYEKRTGKTLGTNAIRMVMVERRNEQGNAEYNLFVVPVAERSVIINARTYKTPELAGDPIYGIVINPSGPQEIRHGSVHVQR